MVAMGCTGQLVKHSGLSQALEQLPQGIPRTASHLFGGLLSRWLVPGLDQHMPSLSLPAAFQEDKVKCVFLERFCVVCVGVYVWSVCVCHCVHMIHLTGGPSSLRTRGWRPLGGSWVLPVGECGLNLGCRDPVSSMVVPVTGRARLPCSQLLTIPMTVLRSRLENKTKTSVLYLQINQNTEETGLSSLRCGTAKATPNGGPWRLVSRNLPPRLVRPAQEALPFSSKRFITRLVVTRMMETHLHAQEEAASRSQGLPCGLENTKSERLEPAFEGSPATGATWPRQAWPRSPAHWPSQWLGGSPGDVLRRREVVMAQRSGTHSPEPRHLPTRDLV